MGEAARQLDSLHGEERQVPRAEVRAAVSFSSDHNFWAGLTMNMSEGGLFVATHHVVPVGTTIVLRMTLPHEDEELVTLAEVRWTRPYNSGHDAEPPGLGLQFVGADAGALAKIRKFVATIREPLFFDDE